MTEKDERIEYGKAHTNFHFAGYAFERGCSDLEWLLEGDRWKLNGRFDDVNKFLESLQLEKFKTVAEERKRIGLRIKELQPNASNRAIAKVFNVDEKTIRNDAAENSAPASQKANGNNGAMSASAENSAPRERSGAEAARLVRNFRQGRGDNEWITPVEYIEPVHSFYGDIDLDPASSEEAQKTIKAKKYLTKEDDGLRQPWPARRLWLNPPYRPPLIGKFVRKLCEEYQARRVTEAIMLTHNYTSSAWFHKAEDVADAICFTFDRVPFQKPNGKVLSAMQGQAFFYFGDDLLRFAEVFKEIGFTRPHLRYLTGRTREIDERTMISRASREKRTGELGCGAVRP
jgi:phage N-6-adenine-methyltransferase